MTAYHRWLHRYAAFVAFLERQEQQPDSSIGTDAADAADGTRLRRRGDARLPAPRDHDAVCGTGYGEGYGDHPVPAASPASGILATPPCRFGRRTGPPTWRCMSSSITMRRTSIRASRGGWRRGRAFMCTSHPPTPRSSGLSVQPDHPACHPPRALQREGTRGGN